MGAGARVHFHVRVHYREPARTYERVNPSNRELPVSALPTAEDATEAGGVPRGAPARARAHREQPATPQQTRPDHAPSTTTATRASCRVSQQAVARRPRHPRSSRPTSRCGCELHRSVNRPMPSSPREVTKRLAELPSFAGRQCPNSKVPVPAHSDVAGERHSRCRCRCRARRSRRSWSGRRRGSNRGRLCGRVTRHNINYRCRIRL